MGVGAVGTKPRKKCSFTFRGLADKCYEQYFTPGKLDHCRVIKRGRNAGVRVEINVFQGFGIQLLTVLLQHKPADYYRSRSNRERSV